MNPRQALARVFIGALALSLVLAVPAVVQPPVAVAACGTEWASKKEPPPTILVLRTETGGVAEVDLKRYVAMVMASGEWPTTLPKAVLEAGALATKQYAWYYALEGNHRDGDHNAAGVCFDVRDDSTDQVYRPESAEPTEKQKSARDALWDLSLRKHDKFLLTGYRQGSATKCAADADGWKLYATSAKDCAKRLDYDSKAILRDYFDPGLKFVWAPGTEPDWFTTSDEDAKETPEGSVRDDEETADPSDTPVDAGSSALDSISGWFRNLLGDSE